MRAPADAPRQDADPYGRFPARHVPERTLLGRRTSVWVRITGTAAAGAAREAPPVHPTPRFRQKRPPKCRNRGVGRCGLSVPWRTCGGGRRICRQGALTSSPNAADGQPSPPGERGPAGRGGAAALPARRPRRLVAPSSTFPATVRQPSPSERGPAGRGGRTVGPHGADRGMRRKRACAALPPEGPAPPARPRGRPRPSRPVLLAMQTGSDTDRRRRPWRREAPRACPAR